MKRPDTILVVENNLTTMQQIHDALGHTYQLVHAASEVDALACTQDPQPALILMTLQSRQINGYNLLCELKSSETTAHIPVIAITALDTLSEEAKVFEQGAADFVTTPLSRTIIQLRVKNQLALAHIAQQRDRAYLDAIEMIGVASRYSDNETGDHISRMADYAAALGKKIGLEPAQCELLRQAAPMHDTGKIGISDHILHKPGPLDSDEWEIMKTHATIGHQILSRSQCATLRIGALIALNHHERWDGTGYPNQLIGQEIPLYARIASVADVFDALVSDRPYKKPWTIEDALEYIESQSGKMFDPQIVKAFMEIKAEIYRIHESYQPAPA